jgi:hypothetical protein
MAGTSVPRLPCVELEASFGTPMVTATSEAMTWLATMSIASARVG